MVSNTTQSQVDTERGVQCPALGISRSVFHKSMLDSPKHVFRSLTVGLVQSISIVFRAHMQNIHMWYLLVIDIDIDVVVVVSHAK